MNIHDSFPSKYLPGDQPSRTDSRRSFEVQAMLVDGGKQLSQFVIHFVGKQKVWC